MLVPNCPGAKLSGAILSGAKLSVFLTLGAKLSGAKMSGCQIVRCQIVLPPGKGSKNPVTLSGFAQKIPVFQILFIEICNKYQVLVHFLPESKQPKPIALWLYSHIISYYLILDIIFPIMSGPNITSSLFGFPKLGPYLILYNLLLRVFLLNYWHQRCSQTTCNL